MASDNLVLRAGTWHVRLTIPVDVRPILNRREFTASLKTGSKAEAQRLKGRYLDVWHEQIDKARGITNINIEDTRFEIKTLSEKVEKLSNYYALNKINKKTNPEFEKLYDELSFLYEDMNSQNDFIRVENKYLEEIDGYRELSEEVANDKNKNDLNLISNFTRMRYKAMINKRIENLPINKSIKNELKQIAKEPETYNAKSCITPTRLQKFKEYQESKSIVQKTVDTQIEKLKRLRTWLEEKKADLTHNTIANYLETLEVTPKTKKQHLFAGESFWKWANKYDDGFAARYKNQLSPFKEHDLPENRTRKTGKADDRKAFSPYELANLHEKALLEKNDQELANVIELGAYTGARIEELFKIKVSDIIIDEDVRCLSITQSKTFAGIRKIPIHKAISKLVDKLAKEAKDEYLLSSTSKNKYGNRSDAVSKRFGRLKTEAGFNAQYVFHSVRKTFITQLHRSGVDFPVIASIVGHETGKITFDIYSSGPSPKQKHDAISRLQYPILKTK